MLQNKVVNAGMQCHGQLMHFQAFAVAKSLALKSLQFLPCVNRCFSCGDRSNVSPRTGLLSVAFSTLPTEQSLLRERPGAFAPVVRTPWAQCARRLS